MLAPRATGQPLILAAQGSLYHQPVPASRGQGQQASQATSIITQHAVFKKVYQVTNISCFSIFLVRKVFFLKKIYQSIQRMIILPHVHSLCANGFFLSRWLLLADSFLFLIEVVAFGLCRVEAQGRDQ